MKPEERENLLIESLNDSQRKMLDLEKDLIAAGRKIADLESELKEYKRCAVLPNNENILEYVKRIMDDHDLSRSHRWHLLEDLNFRISDGMRQLRQTPDAVPGGEQT